MIRENRNKNLILLYHHVIQTRVDPWEMAVNPDHFRDHLEVLSNDYKVMPLGDMATGKPSFSGAAIYLTFDDAYRDNYTQVFPELRKRSLPATFFVATQILNENPTFWWEALEQVLLEKSPVPEILELRWPDGSVYRKKIGQLAINTRPWSAWTGIPETRRQEIYLDLSARIKALPPDGQNDLTGQLLSWLDENPSSGFGSAKMTASQLSEVHQSGLVEIGAHSVHHPVLARLPEPIQIHEIANSKRQLEALLGKPVSTFAYPHGNYDNVTRALVCATGFAIACTTEEGSFDRRHDLMTLPRIWVKDWDKDQFSGALERWLK